jgi:putative tryptophan/tyrosine transport system substrate-binding protein
MVARILRGEDPGNIPVEFATGGEIVVNTRAAAAMGVTIPEAVIERAETVVQ